MRLLNKDATTLSLLAALFSIMLGSSGCGSETENKVSYAELEAVAEELADNLLANPRFQRGRQAAHERGNEIVLALVEPVTIEGDDETGYLRHKIDEFTSMVPEVFLQRDVGVFQRTNMTDGRDLGSDIEGKLEAFDLLSAAELSGTESMAAADYAMQVVAKREKVATKWGGSTYDYSLRVSLFDLARNAQIYSASFTLGR